MPDATTHPPPPDDLARLLSQAPPMGGGEYLRPATLEALWSDLDARPRARRGGLMAFDDSYAYGKFPRYVSVAERRAKALKQARKLEKRGRTLEAVTVTGQRIASSFWGKAWCKNLESYMDFSNRLPRGRTYLRSGAVVDLRIGAGQIDALVAGSSLYQVSVRIEKLARRRWAAVIKRCAGRIDSVVCLLQGGLSDAVLEALVDRRAGLFPAPKEIDFTCSCPDSAFLCKHIAAVLYGAGVRLDTKPELFFTLRSVALEELVTKSALHRAAPAKEALDGDSLEGISGSSWIPDRVATSNRSMQKCDNPAPGTRSTLPFQTHRSLTSRSHWRVRAAGSIGRMRSSRTS